MREMPQIFHPFPLHKGWAASAKGLGAGRGVPGRLAHSHAGLRHRLKAAVTRFSHAHDARADRHGSREVAGCGSAKGAKPPVGPSRRDCRRRSGPRGTAKQQRRGNAVTNGGILPVGLPSVRTIPAPGRAVRENRNSGWRASCVVPTCCSGTARSIFARWMETACWKVQILARLRDHRGAIRKTMERIAGLAAADRETALAQLLILAGLRRLAKTVEQEARKMPIHINILENEVLGRCSRGAWTKGVRKAN